MVQFHNSTHTICTYKVWEKSEMCVNFSCWSHMEWHIMKILPVLLLTGCLTKISGHLKSIVSYKNTQYIVSYVYSNLFVHSITRDFSLPFAMEMYRLPFFSRPSLHREYYRTLWLCSYRFSDPCLQSNVSY